MLNNPYEIKNGYVMIPEADYAALVEQWEDMQDEAALDHALAHAEEFFPEDVLKRFVDGENPLRIFREYRGMTQTQLSEKTNVRQSLISDIEAGRKRGSVDTLIALATALDVDLDDIV